MSRLWIARHAEALPDESGLSEIGRQQADLLGSRLASVPLQRISHSPQARAVETARIVALHLPGVPVEVAAELDDADPSDDPAGAEAMVARFGRPAADELVITHAFQVGWFVRDALEAPVSRWVGLNQCNGGLTVLGYRDGRPPFVMVFNDVTYLPPSLRWTGFPAELRL